MSDGFKAYQKANELQVDGVMEPGGETERHDATARRKERRGLRQEAQKTAISRPVGYYSTNKRFCIPVTGICLDNWVCV